MSRPHIYEAVTEKVTVDATDYQLSTTNIMYALMYRDQWVVEQKHRATYPITKYIKTFYPSYKQAETCKERLEERYNIELNIIELNSEVLNSMTETGGK